MAIRIRNQRPAELYNDPFKLLNLIDVDSSNDDFQAQVDNWVSENIVKPMYDPINTNNPVVIEDDSTNPVQTIDEDTLHNAIHHLWTSDTIDVDIQDQVNEIYRQGIQYHSSNDWFFEEQLLIEALVKNQMPIPKETSTQIVKYSAKHDVIPSAKNYLAHSNEDYASEWFANIASYTRNFAVQDFLLVTVQTTDDFDHIKQTLNDHVNQWQSTQAPINQDTHNLIRDFNNIDISNDLSSTVFMPQDNQTFSTDNPYSFNRIMIYTLADLENQSTQGEVSIQPVDISQLHNPKSIIFLNLENYAHAKANDIQEDWLSIEKAMRFKNNLKITNNKKLMTSSVIQRSTQPPEQNTTKNAINNGVGRSANIPFSGKPVTAKSMLFMMKRIIESQITTKETENTFETQKKTFMRQNRRNPDDINMAGLTKTTNYRPDIHIYLDTSMSITESQYRDAIINLINLTKLIDTNLYFSSFSTTISETTLLQTKNRSVKDIYKQFMKTPKVAGGTDFEQVWRKIDMLDEVNKKTGKSYQLNFFITDFGYHLSRDQRWNRNQASVKYTYYVPVSVGNDFWEDVKHFANQFKRQMIKAGDIDVRRRMLM